MVSDELNNYFINGSQPITSFTRTNIPNFLTSLELTTNEEITFIIKSLDNNCVAVYDQIKARSYKTIPISLKSF